MRIAVIGTGISGMLAAYLLAPEHDLTVFEANDYIGGHTNTIQTELDGKPYAVDTGFIVYNDWTYPNFIKLMDKLGVESQASSMSFSVKCEKTGLEYNGTSLNSLFAQRGNFFRPSFHVMIRDILRFNRESVSILDTDDETSTLGDYLKANGYSKQFAEHYIIPMGAAIWSAAPEDMLKFPLRYFVRFFKNHGMLSVNDRPQWRVIRGGSSCYVEALTQGFRDRIRLNSPVQSVRRFSGGAEVTPKSGKPEKFDKVIIAAHSDQALRMLADPTEDEKKILGAMPYQENEAVLHTDASLLPKRRLAWASWNYHLLKEKTARVSVTYNMNILQTLDSARPFCVTLNRTPDIDPAKIIRRITYHHPVYNAGSIEAQKHHALINGVNSTYFCGAYWGYGFHEDGVKSALEVAKYFGKDLNA